MGTSRVDFQWLAKTRLQEAKALLEKGLFDGAYYLAGYTVECAFKACIAKKIRRSELPDKNFINDVYTHNLDKLLAIAELQVEYQEAMRDKQFAENWKLVRDWSEAARYETLGRRYVVSWVPPYRPVRRSTRAEQRAREMYSAIADKNHGVLTWLKKFW
jgi:HEPN domain-containing protein